MPKIEITKLQANGAGYLLVERSAVGTAGLSRFARAACDLQGLVGGEGIVYVASSRSAYCAVEVYTPKGTLQSFSMNAAVAAAIYNYRRFGRTPVQVALPSGSYAVSLARQPGNTCLCHIKGIEIAAGDDSLWSRLADWLVHSSYDRTVRSSQLIKVGRENWILDVPHVSDRRLITLAKDVAVDLPAAANVPISMMYRLTSRQAFLRTFVPTGHGLVTSCTGSAVAAAAALSSDVPDHAGQIDLQICGPSGATTVTMDATPDRLTAGVDVKGARIYDGLVSWDGSQFEGMMEGDVDLEALMTLGDQADEEIQSAQASRHYTPLPKGDGS